MMEAGYQTKENLKKKLFKDITNFLGKELSPRPGILTSWKAIKEELAAEIHKGEGYEKATRYFITFQESPCEGHFVNDEDSVKVLSKLYRYAILKDSSLLSRLNLFLLYTKDSLLLVKYIKPLVSTIETEFQTQQQKFISAGSSEVTKIQYKLGEALIVLGSHMEKACTKEIYETFSGIYDTLLKFSALLTAFSDTQTFSESLTIDGSKWVNKRKNVWFSTLGGFSRFQIIHPKAECFSLRYANLYYVYKMTKIFIPLGIFVRHESAITLASVALLRSSVRLADYEKLSVDEILESLNVNFLAMKLITRVLAEIPKPLKLLEQFIGDRLKEVITNHLRAALKEEVIELIGCDGVLSLLKSLTKLKVVFKDSKLLDEIVSEFCEIKGIQLRHLVSPLGDYFFSGITKAEQVIKLLPSALFNTELPDHIIKLISKKLLENIKKDYKLMDWTLTQLIDCVKCSAKNESKAINLINALNILFEVLTGECEYAINLFIEIKGVSTIFELFPVSLCKKSKIGLESFMSSFITKTLESLKEKAWTPSADEKETYLPNIYIRFIAEAYTKEDTPNDGRYDFCLWIMDSLIKFIEPFKYHVPTIESHQKAIYCGMEWAKLLDMIMDEKIPPSSAFVFISKFLNLIQHLVRNNDLNKVNIREYISGKKQKLHKVLISKLTLAEINKVAKVLLEMAFESKHDFSNEKLMLIKNPLFFETYISLSNKVSLDGSLLGIIKSVQGSYTNSQVLRSVHFL